MKIWQHTNYNQAWNQPVKNLQDERLTGTQIEFPHRQLSTGEGRHDFAPIHQMVDKWCVGNKQIMPLVKFMPSGLEAKTSPWATDSCADWIYESEENPKGVPGVLVEKKGTRQRVPLPWFAYFHNRVLKPLLADLASDFNGDPHIGGFVVSLGHYCQSTASYPFGQGGSDFITTSGYSSELWYGCSAAAARAYRAAFSQTLLYLGLGNVFIRGYAESPPYDTASLALQVCTNELGIYHHDLRGPDKKGPGQYAQGIFPGLCNQLGKPPREGGRAAPIMLGIDNAVSNPGLIDVYGDPVATALYAIGGGETGLPLSYCDSIVWYMDDILAAQQTGSVFDHALNILAEA
jgi:hypothetical protein